MININKMVDNFWINPYIFKKEKWQIISKDEKWNIIKTEIIEKKVPVINTDWLILFSMNISLFVLLWIFLSVLFRRILSLFFKIFK